MKNCIKCAAEIPAFVLIDGKKRNTQRRKYCLDCSPFGQHNTRKLENVSPEVASVSSDGASSSLWSEANLSIPTHRKNTNSIGNLSELYVLLAFVEAGYLVSLPVGDGCSYDMIVDDSVKLHRVQVKTGHIRSGAIQVFTQTSNGPVPPYVRRYYDGMADLFAVYCPENKKVYVIAVPDKCTAINLRVDPCLNGNTKRIHWARDYELHKDRGLLENTRL